MTEEIKKVDAEFDPLLKSSEELEAYSKKRHAEIQQEIKAIDEESVCIQIQSEVEPNPFRYLMYLLYVSYRTGSLTSISGVLARRRN